MNPDLTQQDDSRIGCRRCGHLACVCAIRRRHAADCKFRIAAAGAVGIECPHGRDCCPECDPCTCGAGVDVADFADESR